MIDVPETTSAPSRWRGLRQAAAARAPELALVAILMIAAALRFTGLDWDENTHLHPDERFLTMVETGIRLPSSIGEYFDTDRSGLNPHNVGYGFFVYGTLPIFMVRYLADWLGQLGYDQVHLIGRATSAVFDLIGLVLLYAIGRRLHSRRVGLLAALIGAFTVLFIQHSHFFVVDTVTNVFILVGLYLAIRVQEDGLLWRYAVFGLVLGMAVASKISAAPLAGIVVLAAGFHVLRAERSRRDDEIVRGLIGVLLAAFVAFLAFRIFQPYAFSGPGFFGLRPNPKWISNLQEIRNQSGGSVDVPFALQWAYRPKFLFSWLNMVQWGMGLPLGLVAWAGTLWAAVEVARGRWSQHALLLVWTLGYFLWQAAAFNPTLRYQLPVYPTLILFAAWAAVEAWSRLKETRASWSAAARIVYAVIGGLALLGHVAYGIAFTSIYTRPVTRVAASRWIYTHVPGPLNLVMTGEAGQWIEPVPLPGDFVLSANAPHLETLTPGQAGLATGIRLPFVRDLGGNDDQTVLRADILAEPQDTAPLATATWIGSLPSEPAQIPLVFEVPFPLDPGRTYVLRLSVAGREGIALDGNLVLLASTPEGEAETSMALPQEQFTLTAGVPFEATFISASGGEARTLHVPFAQTYGGAQSTNLQVSLLESPDAPAPLATAEWTGSLPGREGTIEATFDQPVTLTRGVPYWIRIDLRSGVGLSLRGSRIISETSWDDGLPLRLDFKDGYGGLYTGLNQ
ncbi:MAG TPA: glycosyltransferase family 39 protein, partial [Anaerolineales bacterium]|nr:glycosyltransferase family 39 protein [Anaerolineales bacterium]